MKPSTKVRANKLPFILILSFMALGSMRAGTNDWLISLHGNGSLSWPIQTNAAGYVVLWAPSLKGPWSADWDALRYVTATSTVVQVPVPMFYKVASVDNVAYTNTLLIHGDHVDTPTSVTDVAGHTINVLGDTHATTNQSKFGGASIYFDGSGDFLSLPAGGDWAFGTGDFTVDFWVNFTVTPTAVNLCGPHHSGIYSDWTLLYNAGTLGFYINGSAAASTIWSPTPNTWYHFAATRAGGVLRLFINGHLVSFSTNNSSIGTTDDLTLGATVNGTLFLTGYLDEIRINKGLAVWTNNFVPPAAAYLQ